MKLKNQLKFTLAATLVFSCAITALALILNQVERGVEDAQRRRYESFLLADELRQSSDDLTRFSRMYVATGDERYLRFYWNILDIRNGKISRPEGYEGVYWDLVVGGIIPEPISEKNPESRLKRVCSRLELLLMNSVN